MRKLLLVLALLFLSLFVATASATTDANVDPDGDATITDAWQLLPTGGTHFSKIDDGIRYNNVPTLTDYLYLDYYGDSSGDVALSMTTLTGVNQVTAIKIWIYTYNQGGSGTTIDISKDGSTWVGAQAVTYQSPAAWRSATFDLSGSPWTQSNLDNLQVKLVGWAGGADDYETYLYAMYAEITYDEAVPEYSLMVFVAVLVSSIAIAFAAAHKK